MGARNVVVHRAAAEAGPAVLDARGDFADGVIAWEGRRGETLFRWNAKSPTLLARQGQPSQLLPWH
jgi:hypothetical protein